MKRHFQRTLTMSALFAVTVLAVLGAFTMADAKTVKGTVVSMDNTMIMLRTADGMEHHFTLGTGVQIPANVGAGSTVELTVDDATGSSMVSMITVPATPAASPVRTDASEYETTRSDLPETAGPAATYAVTGILALVAAYVIARRRRGAGRS